MCIECWENYGRPKIVSPKTISAALAVRKLYVGAPTGGAMHIVTNDWNLEDDSIEYCRSKAEKGSEDEKKVFSAFISMSFKERASALALSCGFIAAPELGGG